MNKTKILRYTSI